MTDAAAATADAVAFQEHVPQARIASSSGVSHSIRRDRFEAFLAVVAGMLASAAA